MDRLLSLGATYFHEDVSLAAGTGAGTVTIFDPGQAALLITRIRLSTDTGQRIVVGTADAAGQRIVAVQAPGGGAGVLADLELQTAASAMAGKPIVLITAAVSGADVAIEGYVLPHQLANLLSRGELPELVVMAP